MDQLSQQEFNRVTSLKPHELTTEDIEFLWGRREYLNRSQTEEFADVLKERAKRVEVGETQSPAAKTK